MKQFNILTCGLLVCASVVAVSPQSHADYVADEGAAMITAQSDSLNESHSNYSILSGASAYPDGGLSGQSMYTAKGGRLPSSGGTAGPPPALRAAVTAQYYWSGEGEIGPPYTFRFFPGYIGTASGSKGTFAVSVDITGSQSGQRRPASPGSPQDDWDLDGGGGVDFSYSYAGAIDGPVGNFGTVEGDMRSYPCLGTSGFSVTTSFTSNGTATAAGIGATASLQETITLYKEISIDN